MIGVLSVVVVTHISRYSEDLLAGYVETSLENVTQLGKITSDTIRSTIHVSFRARRMVSRRPRSFPIAV